MGCAELGHGADIVVVVDLLEEVAGLLLRRTVLARCVVGNQVRMVVVSMVVLQSISIIRA